MMSKPNQELDQINKQRSSYTGVGYGNSKNPCGEKTVLPFVALPLLSPLFSSSPLLLHLIIKQSNNKVTFLLGLVPRTSTFFRGLLHYQKINNKIWITLMGGKQSYHLKTQKQQVFGQEVTRGARPVKGKARQNAERDQILYHINHQTIQNRPRQQTHINTDTMLHNNNIRNPKVPQSSSGKTATLLDNRTKATFDAYPYTCIGLLQVGFENRRIRGTAFLISSNWLLTCAHNLYDRRERRMGTHPTFTLALQEKEQIVRENGKEYRSKVDVGDEIEISTWRIPDEYINGDDQTAELYDFALVKVNNFYNLEQKYGYFGLDSVWAFERANLASQLIVAGYPRQVKNMERKCKILVQGRGQWTEIMNDENRKKSERLLYLNYNIFTSPGQSGAPIFYETKDKEFFMIGIHTLGGDEQNSGVLITPKAREIINGWIEQMKTIFDISNRNISKEEMKVFIISFIEFSHNITQLQLANNRIGPQGIMYLMKTKWTNLKSLNLENNNIKPQGAKHLAHPSNGWTNLEYLNLNNTMIGDEGCCILLQNRAWSKLKQLHLRRSSITTLTATQLSNHQWLSLQTLNLGLNQLKIQDMKLLFDTIRTHKVERKRFPRLRNLNLNKNQIGNEGLQTIVKGEYQLSSLNITGIGIDHHGMQILASVRWEKLKKLCIDWNKQISIEGIKFLTPNVFPSLTLINLDWTALGAQGIKELMIHQWKTLKNLSLNHNYLGDQGLNELKSHGTIQALVLQGNNITTQGIKKFAAKAEWRNLLQLRLRSNHIKKGGFGEAINQLKDLNCLDINNNGLDAHEKREIRQQANKNNPNLQVIVDMGEEADYT